MGVILPKPILSKVVDRVGSEIISAGCCCINGYRNTMEDAHVMDVEKHGRMVFGVFDGHSNDKCSNYVAEHLRGKLHALPPLFTDAQLEKVCIEIDEQFLEDVGEGGTTATFCMVEYDPSTNKYSLVIANVGDSRTIVARDGKVAFATTDHKPSNAEEKARIERCGGSVRMNRVDGDLAVSRAFGDGPFKRVAANDLRNQKVIAVPDITRLALNIGDVIVIACDGVFEGNFVNEEVVSLVFSELDAKVLDLGVVSAKVCDMAVRRGSKDNISCMVVQLQPGVQHAATFGHKSFVPGPPYPKTHEASRTAYARMAALAGYSLADALQMRFDLLQSLSRNTMSQLPPIQQLAFSMSDEIDLESERIFFGQGPVPGNEKSFFESLANGGGH